jgi:hypothetical protein
MRFLLKKPTISRTYPRVSLLHENKTLPSKLARRGRARKWLNKAQVKNKKNMMMMRAPNMIPMR